MNIRKRASDLWTSLRYDGVHTDMSDTRKHVDRIAEALASVERETLEQAAKEADAIVKHFGTLHLTRLAHPYSVAMCRANLYRRFPDGRCMWCGFVHTPKEREP